jgi:ribosome biogenesis protein ERB1
MQFYEEYDHIGYNLSGKKIAKPTDGQRDNVDWFLERHDDPNFW